MSGERLRSLRSKYLRLGIGEVCAAAVFSIVGLTTVVPRLDDAGDGAAFWCALAPLVIVLTQGGAYWLLARSWIGVRPMPSKVVAVFRVARVVDIGLLTAGAMGIVFLWPHSPGTAAAVVAVWLFGVAEYLNYFMVRLAYPVTRWVRSPVGARRGSAATSTSTHIVMPSPSVSLPGHDLTGSGLHQVAMAGPTSCPPATFADR